MIATELIARSTEMPTSTLNELGLRMKMTIATTMMARNRPPIRSAMSKVALAGRREPLAIVVSDGRLAGFARSCWVHGRSVERSRGRRAAGPACRAATGRRGCLSSSTRAAATPSAMIGNSVWVLGRMTPFLRNWAQAGPPKAAWSDQRWSRAATWMPFSMPSSWPFDTFQPMVKTCPVLFRLSIARLACSAPMSTFSMNWTSGLAERNVR